jgi:hypothetical protein
MMRAAEIGEIIGIVVSRIMVEMGDRQARLEAATRIPVQFLLPNSAFARRTGTC